MEIDMENKSNGLKRYLNKNIIVIIVTAACIYGLALWSIIEPDKTYSYSERRGLKTFPKLSGQTLQSGRFMEEFEKYTLDQFPMRDTMRMFKAVGNYYLFGRKDNNGLYIADGYLSKLEYPLNEASLDYAALCFSEVNRKYLEGKVGAVYGVIVPDKNYFLADKNGYPSMDYDEFYSLMKDKLDFMQLIDVRGLLSYDDYYRTDTHWRQERIVDAAREIADKMGVTLSAEYELKQLATPFCGVYYGQVALPIATETLYYLENEAIKNSTVTDYETGKTGAVYDMEKAEGNDLYEMFLSGPRSLLVIDNPSADTDKELIIFRDSFGSSIAPLFIEAYSKITLVDIRYISPAYLGRFIEFDGQDVLFLYSTLVLNNSDTIIR